MDAVETFSTDAGDFLGTEIGFSAVVADATSYGWDFGDGTSGSGASVSHRFSAVGTYAVTLEVVENGKTTSSTSNIAVRFTQVVRPAIDVAGTGDGDVSGTGGIACAIADGVASGTCQAQFDAGDVIELTATPAPGFVFQGWSGCESPADDVCTHTVTDDATITANFAETYTLTVRAQGGPGRVVSDPAGTDCPSTSTCSADFPAGTVVQLTASAPSFNLWVRNDSAPCLVSPPDPDPSTWPVEGYETPVIRPTMDRDRYCAASWTF